MKLFDSIFGELILNFVFLFKIFQCGKGKEILTNFLYHLNIDMVPFLILGFPDVFTRVFYHLEWIQDHIQKHSADFDENEKY